ncbi:hypothetical protein CERSUDRAFT_118781 [Gelatoporia subvermispora B]|uniref:Uncharacterized protein n=1 Tax=Ceriporiopsis subvermispora (strain B) TaxID=914234 RepID=M2QK24_CERS8|nr:hypothetical protein CERSUDRAFT_118781 [Gelatoporia subvermispora B]
MFRSAERFRERYFETNIERWEYHRRLNLERITAAQAAKRSRFASFAGSALRQISVVSRMCKISKESRPRHGAIDFEDIRHQARKLRIRLDTPYLDRAMQRADPLGTVPSQIPLNRFYAARGGRDYFLTTGGDFVEVSKCEDLKPRPIPEATGCTRRGKCNIKPTCTPRVHRTMRIAF